MKKQPVYFLLILILCFHKDGMGQMPDSVRAYIDSAIYFMQTKSLNGKGLNWKKIRNSSFAKATGARNYREAFPALAYAFHQLKDYHGLVAGPDTFYRYPAPVNFSEALSPGIKKEFLKGPRIVTAFFNNRIAYLRVPGMNVTRQEAMDEKANQLRDSLCMLLSQHPQGIVIDLRMNTGGNSAPMQSGIGPLFQSEVLGYGVDRNGTFLSPVRLKDGVVLGEKGEKEVNIKNTCKPVASIPIAVLIGPSTVSSGEILAAYLRQQPNVRLFGEPTPGFCSATEGFQFMKEQGYLLLTVTRIADAKKHVYRELLVRPDVYVKSQDNYENLLSDPTVLAGLNWLEQKAGTR